MVAARSVGSRGPDDSAHPALERQVTVLGVGGIGWGRFFALRGTRTLSRSESRSARLVDARDYCKLHIVLHWLATLTRDEPVRPRIVAIGGVGDDEPGRRLVAEMEAVGIDTRAVSIVRDRPTTYTVALQYPDGAGCNVTSSNGASGALSPSLVRRAVEAIPEEAVGPIAIALPEVPVRIRRAFLQALDGRDAFRIAAFTSAEIPGAFRDGLLERVDLLALNEDEAAALVGRPLDPADPESFIGVVADRLTSARPEIQVVLTAGARGAFAFHGGRWDHCPAPDVPVVSTAGAGDALLAGVITARLAGLPLTDPDRSGRRLQERGITSGLDLGVLAAALKLGAADTIPLDVSWGAMWSLADRLAIVERPWPAPRSAAGR